MPAPTTLDELNAAARIMRRELRQRSGNVALSDMKRNLVHRQWLGGGEQGGFYRALELVHQAAFFKLMGAKASSWAKSSRPRRASSSIARKLDASAERRS